MADPLARWAAERAPELAARAEAEAVAMLRDALVRAALGERERPQKPAAPARAPAESHEPGELLWAYCVLLAALDALAGRQEWGVKVLVDPDKLMAQARDSSEQPDEPPESTGGGAYMLRRRAERRAREVADSLAAELAGQVHARLEDWAID